MVLFARENHWLMPLLWHVFWSSGTPVSGFLHAISGTSSILPDLFLTFKKQESAWERWFLHLLNRLRTAYRTDGFLYGTLVAMTTPGAMLMVPNQFIKGKILASARWTHDASRTITPYRHNKKNIVLNPCLVSAGQIGYARHRCHGPSVKFIIFKD